VQGSVRETLEAAEAGSPIPVGAEVVLIGVGVVVLAVVARVVFALLPRRSVALEPVPAEGGAAR